VNNLFESPRLTLKRAEHHIGDFNEAADDYTAAKSWTHFVDRTSQPGNDIYKIRFHPLPEMLPCILFDAANNLRSVLDQIGYAAAVAARSQSLKYIKFPFGPSRAEFLNNLAGGCKDLPQEVRLIFENSNAYPAGNIALWAVNKIANTNKHLAIKPLVIGNLSAFFNARIQTKEFLAEAWSPGGAGIGWDQQKNELSLMSTPTAMSEAKVDMPLNIMLALEIEGIPELAGKSLAELLKNARDEVERILSTVEAECVRLGFQLGG